MKLRGKMFKLDSDDAHNCDVYYDGELTKGLYLVGSNTYVKRNVKLLR